MGSCWAPGGASARLRAVQHCACSSPGSNQSRASPSTCNSCYNHNADCRQSTLSGCGCNTTCASRASGFKWALQGGGLTVRTSRGSAETMPAATLTRNGAGVPSCVDAWFTSPAVACSRGKPAYALVFVLTFRNTCLKQSRRFSLARRHMLACRCSMDTLAWREPNNMARAARGHGVKQTEQWVLLQGKTIDRRQSWCTAVAIGVQPHALLENKNTYAMAQSSHPRPLSPPSHLLESGEQPHLATQRPCLCQAQLQLRGHSSRLRNLELAGLLQPAAAAAAVVPAVGQKVCCFIR
jgi:hypothetical protein